METDGELREAHLFLFACPCPARLTQKDTKPSRASCPLKFTSPIE